MRDASPCPDSAQKLVETGPELLPDPVVMEPDFWVVVVVYEHRHEENGGNVPKHT